MHKATVKDLHAQNFAADILDAQASHREAFGDSQGAAREREAAKRHRRSAWMIRRHLNAERVTGQPAPVMRPAVTAAPRERRYRRASNPSRAGPSDDEGPSDEPPPAGGRLCDCGCGLPLTGRRPNCHYVNAAHRKRHQRARDRLTPERVALRAVENGTATRPRKCRCRPAHHLHDRGVCVKCGRARAVVVAWITEARDLKSKQLVARAPARRNPRLGDGKRRPPNEFVDESIVRAVAA